MGKWCGTVEAKDDTLIIDGKSIKVLAVKNPAELPWKDMDVKIVVESTGIFRSKESPKGGYGDHLKAGASKVVLTVPAKDDIEATVVMGVNDDIITAKTQCVSNASCTTNCLAPAAKVLQDRFGIRRALMSTIHAYTNGQQILDMAFKDLRRARTAGTNIIPTTTGAAKAVSLVIPELDGKFDGMAFRVPVVTVSVVDLVAELEKETTVEEVNAAFREASLGNGWLGKVLGYTEEPLVSTDFIGSEKSSTIDALSTQVIGGDLVKVVAWYDNEWSYSVRLADLAAFVAEKL
jgi:glyceraldehyde 3-phosphate dehydrogenase